MDIQGFAEMTLGMMPFTPTDQQIKLVAALARFCSAHTPQDSVFILNGYAGTGKTSVTAGLVKALSTIGIPTVLLASTGRAAKVFSGFTGRPAYTIHRKIYGSPVLGPDGRFHARLLQNPHVNTVFIVDEASMIGGEDSGESNLLNDLVMYVYGGMNCRLILIGDTAQLPPVGCSESPAMSPEVLRHIGLRVSRATMTQTVRQRARSGILYNATWLRRAMLASPLPEPQIRLAPFKDVTTVEGYDLEDAIQHSYTQFGEDQTIIITRSNRSAVDLNLAVRHLIFDRQEILSVGERLVLAKNSYFWTKKVEGVDFLANGETAIVEHIYGMEPRDYSVFADVCLHLPDLGISLDVKLNLDSLTSDSAALPYDKLQSITRRALRDAGALEAAPTTQRRILREDPYYNALQVKYAYAVTCHKAQGGQWDSVFIDLGYVPPELYGTVDFYRWLYTAVTRATKRLALINPVINIVE